MLSNETLQVAVKLGEQCSEISGLSHQKANLEILLKESEIDSAIQSFKTKENTKEEDACVLEIFLSGNEKIKAWNRINEAVSSARHRASDGQRLDAVSAFLRENSAQYVYSLTAEQKSRLFYQQCKTSVEGPNDGDQDGLRELAAMISSDSEKVSSFLETNDGPVNTPVEGFCPRPSHACTVFTEFLAELHSISAHSLIAPRVLDLLKANINSDLEILAFMQPHFIGTYPDALRTTDCDAARTDFSKVHFESSKDADNLARFKVLAGFFEETFSESELEQLVVFEKRLVSNSFKIEGDTTTASLEKISVMFTFEMIKRHLPHVADWEAYVARLFSGIEQGEHDPRRANYVLICKSYFFGLEALMKITKPKVILNYVKLSAMLLTRKFPQLFTRHQREILALEAQIDCAIISESGFAYSIGHQFSKVLNISKKEKILQTMIPHIKAAGVDFISQQKWMTRQTMMQAAEKIQSINFVIGIPAEFRNLSHVNHFYYPLRLEKTFAMSFVAVKKFVSKQIFATLFLKRNQNNMVVLSLFNEANASYDTKENGILINAGLLAGPFNIEKMDKVVLMGTLGSVISHEIMHSFGLSGIHFGLDGVFSKKLDVDTMKGLRDKQALLRPKIEAVCQTEYQEGNKHVVVLPNYQRMKEEIVADIGGVEIAYKALGNYLGPDRFTPVEKKRFFVTVLKIFCKKSSPQEMEKMYKSHRHPPDHCRQKYISHLKIFNEANGCKRDQNELSFLS